ncbi:MAG TPA: hypothetical protein VHT28_05935 [Silvibacterium sp.]|nr:hypothetical protein [Silvibacterium sp.]
MSGVITAEIAPAIRTQQLLFAGQPILLRTNASEIARYASGFFPEVRDTDARSTPPLATITLMQRETDEPLCENAPWFRARGHFALARFTRNDSFWFNLRAREVYGTFSSSLVDDRKRWCIHIFPALLGILAAAIEIAPVHAACLARHGRGVLLAGHSGAGKSTLTISLAKRGYALLADDWTYLSAAGTTTNGSGVEAWGIPVPVKLLSDACDLFPELLAYRLGTSLNNEIAYEVWPEECFGVSRLLHCPITAIALLERANEPGCRVSPISADEAIDHLVKELEPPGESLASCYEKQIDLIHRLANASCYRVSFNDHPYRVAAILDRALFPH